MNFESRPYASGWVRIALFTESVLFPLAFLWIAIGIVRGFFEPLAQPVLGVDTAWKTVGVLFDLVRHPENLPAGAHPVHIYGMLTTVLVKPLIMFSFTFLCAAFIALRTRPKYAPTSAREILIPLAGTTVTLLLPLSDHLPSWLGHTFTYPPESALAVFSIAAAISLVGGLLALYGISYVRRNFSVFVEVREVVLNGPYRYLRHPLYSGEMILQFGFVLTVPSYFGFAVFILLVALQYWRARMEEQRLAAASPEYAARLAESGMFFPRITTSGSPARLALGGHILIGIATVALVVSLATWSTQREELKGPLAVASLEKPVVSTALAQEDAARAAPLRAPGALTPSSPMGSSLLAAAPSSAPPLEAAQASPAGGVDAAKLERLLAEAQRAHQERDWRLAADKYAELAEAAPQLPDVQLYLGFCLLRAGELERAVKTYEDAHQRMPESAEAANGLAWTLLETGGSVPRAVELAEFASGRAPTPYHFDTLGRAYVKAHDCDRAATAASRVQELDAGGELYRALQVTIDGACK